MLTSTWIKYDHEWYRVSVPQVYAHRGGPMLQYYKGSLIRALRALYPSKHWNYWNFSHPHHTEPGKPKVSKVQHLLLGHIQHVFDIEEKIFIFA